MRILSDFVYYSSESVKSDLIDIDNYITTECLLSNKLGRRLATNLPPQPCSLTKYEAGDILIGNIRPYLKKIWFANSNGGCSNDVLVLKAKNGFSSLYIYYCLLADSFFEHMMRGAKGSKMPRGDKNQILRYTIPDFSQIDQQQIANTLSLIDKKIRINNSINEVLSAFIRQLYNYWFVQFDFPNEKGEPYKSSGGKMVWSNELSRFIPANWRVDKISNVYNEFTKGITTKYVTQSNLLNLNQKVNKGNILDKQYFKFLDDTISIPKSKFARRNDILINSLGQGTLGRVHFYNEISTNVVVDQHVFILRTNRQKISPSCLYFYFEDLYQSGIIESFSYGSTGMQMLNKSTIDNFVILLPELSLTKVFDEHVDSLFKKIALNNFENEKLGSLRDWLLPLLMSGQVKVKPQIEESVLNIAAEPVAEYGKLKVKDCSSVDNAILAGYIIHKNKNKEFGRVKLVKQLYLTEQLCELDLHSNFYRNTAGPYDENLVNNAESMLNRYNFYRTEKQRTRNGHTLVCYKEQSAAFEITQLFSQNFAEKKELIDCLLDKLCKLTGDMNEIIATLFAVWNNRLIRKQSISDEVLIQDFYDWSEHKHDFPEKLVLKALGFMREENIIPSGCGKYIDVAA